MVSRFQHQSTAKQGAVWILQYGIKAVLKHKNFNFNSLTKEKELNKMTSECREEPGAKDVMGKRHLKGR